MRDSGLGSRGTGLGIGVRGSGFGVRDSGFGIGVQSDVGAAVELPHHPALESRSPSPEPRTPPFIPSLSPLPSPLSSPFVGGPVFSYMVATLILGVMLLGAWAYKVTHDYPNVVT